jgi:hypothetical protein
VTETEVLANDDFNSAELIRQYPLNERDPGLAGDCCIEGDDTDLFDAKRLESFEALFERGEQQWGAIGREDPRRMGIEGDHGRHHTTLLGERAGFANDSLMSTMKTVKDANRNNRRMASERRYVVIEQDNHDSKLLTGRRGR